MALTQYTRDATSGTGSGDAAQILLLTEGDVRLMADNPEQVMEDIRLRAERVSAVLEGILLEPHGQSHWGINE